MPINLSSANENISLVPKSQSPAVAGTVTTIGEGVPVPSGWLECDGSQVSNTTYAELDTALGQSYDDGTELAGNFRLPKLSPDYAFENWISFTPTWSNITVGDGTSAARYKVTGNMMYIEAEFVWGSTSAGTGTFGLTLPSAYEFDPTDYVTPSGFTRINGEVSCFDDTGTGNREIYQAVMTNNTTMEFNGRKIDGGGLNIGISAAQPFTWATGDRLRVNLNLRVVRVDGVPLGDSGKCIVKAFSDVSGASFSTQVPRIITKYSTNAILFSTTPGSGTFNPDTSSGYGISYDSGTGIFTFTIAGTYALSGMIFYNRADGGHYITRSQINYSGTYSGMLVDTNANSTLDKFTETISLSGLFSFAAGSTMSIDYVINTNVNGNIRAQTNDNYICFHRVGEA